MAGGNWNNPWKLTTIALALVGATALATGLVVANWTGKAADKQATVADKQPVVASAPGSAAPRVAQAPAAPAPAVPTQSAIAPCNQAAATQSGHRDKTVDTVKDAGIGAIAAGSTRARASGSWSAAWPCSARQSRRCYSCGTTSSSTTRPWPAFDATTAARCTG